VEVTLKEHLAEVFPPEYEVGFIICPKVYKSHVPYKFYTVDNSFPAGPLLVDIIATNPFSRHDGQYLRLGF
jgi:hypothetical protein